MRQLRQFGLAGLLAMVALLTPGGGPAQAATAGAAASTIFVDDPRDGIQCPGALSLLDLTTQRPFPIVSGQTLTFCSGTYSGPLLIQGVDKVRITGKVDPILGAPRIVPLPGSTFPDLITIQDSTNVTVSGLILDGSIAGSATTAWGQLNPNGIHIFNSSATVSGNLITRIRTNNAADNSGVGIAAVGNLTAPLKLTITGNIIFDFDKSGIAISDQSGNYELTIKGNRIEDLSTTSNPVGIALDHVTKGTIATNTLVGSFDYRNGMCVSCIGINLSQTQNIKVTGNKIQGQSLGIFADSANLALTNNTISGNLIVGSQLGIRVAGFGDGVANGISGNKITGNTLVNYAQSPGAQAIENDAPNTSVQGRFGNNVITGNTMLGYGPMSQALAFINAPLVGFKVSGNKVGIPLKIY